MGLGIDTDVNRVDISFNKESHHFILYKMGDNVASNVRDGMRDIEDAGSAMFNNALVSAWQDEHPHALPENTAYRFRSDTYLDLNYHLKNYFATGVLASEVYINIYTQPHGTAQHEMYATLVPYDIFGLFFNEDLGQDLIIPNTGDPITFSDHIWFPNLPFIPYPDKWHIWQLSTHTHSRGIDYDIYRANPDGSKGEQIYEGFYNFDYTFNQGYFDYEHPPIRTFDPPIAVEMGQGAGIIQEATYINNEADTLGWGDTTDDEMMLIFVHFTEFAITDVDEPEATPTQLTVFPNPVQDQTTITYELPKSGNVSVEVFDVLGKKVNEIANEYQQKGSYTYSLDVAKSGLSNGVYLINVSIEGQVAASEKVIISN